MSIDAKAFRQALGQFATGIAVVTGRDREGRPIGVTVNAFSSVSLDPPLVLFCLGRESASHPALVEGERFAVNVLARDQQGLSDRFAGKAADKFLGLDVDGGLGEVPLLRGCLARIECRREATHPGGDHDILVGRVERLAVNEGAGEPLLYFRGDYRHLGPTL
ncbi:MAG: flavin reductase family protein [Magnetospirillum sp. WYHS-4]